MEKEEDEEAEEEEEEDEGKVLKSSICLSWLFNSQVQVNWGNLLRPSNLPQAFNSDFNSWAVRIYIETNLVTMDLEV